MAREDHSAERSLVAVGRVPEPAPADYGPPSLALSLLEGRAVLEYASTFPLRRLLARAPRGDGHPVLVLPGFGASERSTGPLRKYLKEQGYAAHDWKLGRNMGPSASVRESLGRRFGELSERYGRRVSLVGWSLGGIYARELAKRRPAEVRCVITLGSPFGDAGGRTNVARLVRLVTGEDLQRIDPARIARLRQPPPVPTTAIYSRSDGVVSWQSCRHEEIGALSENIEVPGSHCGLAVNPAVMYLIAERLAQAEGNWHHFEPHGLAKLLYKVDFSAT